MTRLQRNTRSRRALHCHPPAGRTYLSIGQDLFSIEEYLDTQYNASLHRNATLRKEAFLPSSFMFYTDIQSLRGLSTPVDYGSGIEYANGLLEYSTKVGLQIGLWLNASQGCRDIIDGGLDDQIHSLFGYLRNAKTPQVFLRVGYGMWLFVWVPLEFVPCMPSGRHRLTRLLVSLFSSFPCIIPIPSSLEFDNPSFGYIDDPFAYKQAFRILYEHCLYQQWDCPSKVSFVWHSWADSSPVPLHDMYPGNDAVDWIGVSLFQQPGNPSKMEHVYKVLDYANKHRKPIMIAESTPFGGIFNTTWQDWFAPVFQLIERYDIDMWSYINCNWNAQPMWHGIGFGDTRLSISDDVMQQWNEQILESPRFLGAGSLSKYCAEPIENMEDEQRSSRQHSGSKKRHAKGPSNRIEGVPRHLLPHKRELLIASFGLFWIVLVFWVQQRRQRDQRRGEHEIENGHAGMIPNFRNGAPIIHQYEYGAIETTR